MTDLISSFMTDDLVVERADADGGQWVDGRFVRSAPTTIQMKASVQPLKGNEALILPEHRRNSEAVKIYTCDRLFPTDEKRQTAADVVSHDGKRYEIHSVQNWTTGKTVKNEQDQNPDDLNTRSTDLPHYKAIAVMIDGGGAGGDR